MKIKEQIKILNKSKRIIDGIKPLKLTSVDKEIGEKLKSMYGDEIELYDLDGSIEIADGLKETISNLSQEKAELEMIVESLKDANETLKIENKELSELRVMQDEENESLRKEIEELKLAIAQTAELIENPEDEDINKKSPGRPKKN